MSEEKTTKTTVSEQPVFAPLKSNKESIPGETKNDILLPVMARMRKRLATLKEQSSAKTTKYPRGSSHQHVTIAPKMFIKELTPVLNNQNLGTITYGVYKMGADGNKFVDEHYETDENGKRRLVNATPVIEKTVVETFEYHKEGVMESFKEDYN